MSLKRVVPRGQAGKDIEDAVDHYLEQAGEKVALGFIGALESAFRAIARNPTAGSPR